MKKRRRIPSFFPPAMMAKLTMASWETIARRTALMVQGQCSAAEYQRMVTEKATAARLSATSLMLGRGGKSVLAPFATRASANAKRLRRRRVK